MTFLEALDRKIAIDRMARQVASAVGMPGKCGKIDKAVMRDLVKTAGYIRVDQRDLELYRVPSPDAAPRTLVLDNELAVYRTGPEDVALRKSPDVKEMIILRNIRKILYDSGAVVSKYDSSVAAVHGDCMATLDLSYTDADIAALADDGRTSVMTFDIDAMIKNVDRFAELLDLNPPTPRPVQGRVWLESRSTAPWTVVVDRITPVVALLTDAENPAAATAMADRIISHDATAGIQGVDVFDCLAERIRQDQPAVRRIRIAA